MMVAAEPTSSYTQSMKTAISIPDDVFAEAEGLARRLNRSRSQIYVDALREYLARHDSASTTERMNRVCDDVGSQADPWVVEAGKQALERAEW